MSSITRRAVIGGLTAIAAAAPTAAYAIHSTSQQDVGAIFNGLLEDYLRLSSELNALNKAEEAAQASLPDWARPGRKMVRSDGSFTGEMSYWPMREGWTLPDRDMLMHNVRPSLKDIRQNFEIIMWRKPGPIRAADRRKMFKVVRVWIARVREQQAEEVKAGLPAISLAMDDLCERMGEVSAKINALKVTDGNPNYAVGMMCMSLTNWGGRKDVRFSDSEMTLLSAIRVLHPFTTGCTRNLAGGLLATVSAEDAPWTA